MSEITPDQQPWSPGRDEPEPIPGDEQTNNDVAEHRAPGGTPTHEILTPDEMAALMQEFDRLG